MTDIWFFLGATVSMIATSFMVAIAVKKKFFAAGLAYSSPVIFLVGVSFSILCANAYSDYKNKLLRDESQLYIKDHKAFGEAVLHGLNSSLHHQGQALLIMNDNLLKLQNTVITGRKQPLKEIEIEEEK
jgi:hypothetical protein